MSFTQFSYCHRLHIVFNRGATYADSLRYQRCIDLWRLALQVRVERHSILYSDTCFTAQALIRLMLDLQDDVIDEEHIRYNEQSATQFEDVYAIFELLSNDLFGKHFAILINLHINYYINNDHRYCRI